MIVTGCWTDPAESERNIRWIRETWQALQPYAKASVYVNYTDTGDEGPHRSRLRRQTTPGWPR